MSQAGQLQLRLELIWWVFTAIVAAGVIFPIYLESPEYPFYFINVLFIIIFITVARHIFLLKHTFLAYRQTLKIVIAILCMPALFFIVQEITNFQTFIDEQGVEALVGNLSLKKSENMASYIRNEMLLFGVGSAISIVILFFRLIISVWRVRNRDTV